MILKKQVKENIIKSLYDSSNVLASIYDTNTNDLIIIFKSGTQYKYPNVSLNDYTRLEIAESQGVVFNTHIKKYQYEKLENVNVQEILNEAVILKDQEQNALEKAKRMKIIKLMKNIILIDDTVPFDKNQFENNLKTLDMVLKEFL
jgi:hypothetical protein